ncbi:uncharacterized protein FOMMEDRAFT_161839 [Fomitiporia mediterranea MF3/22]|uniref:uncharacterized protein n=1 Tax=Fomitiporia mediterranea (strain MF3/22) TaxID=694068 RepID=UPI0004407C2F|nr:uncharacterized protein FOMMEDRAFT_161839 [Fomitiporia mediterranea MF3/22]EJC98466.1 hypothetical protein FOMMEDRAFT_161839 [Fomitiporia mediterranea MF3/22]
MYMRASSPAPVIIPTIELMTYFENSPGACGIPISNEKLVGLVQISLNKDYFGSGSKNPHCNKNIIIKVGGKTAKGVLADKCMTCFDADLTPALYAAVAPDGTNTDPQKGPIPKLNGSWTFDD